jgi:hypothetical protein
MQVYETPEAFVVAEVSERKHPTEAQFAAEKDKLRQQAVEARRMELLRSYVDALRKQANITTNDALVGPKPEQS